jgi:hypothetical protein
MKLEPSLKTLMFSRKCQETKRDRDREKRREDRERMVYIF